LVPLKKSLSPAGPTAAAQAGMWGASAEVGLVTDTLGTTNPTILLLIIDEH